MELNGADIVVRCLAEEGVEHVFGYPGGAVLYIYDAIFKQDKFQHILVRHEQAAVHAADAYSRSSQKVGVCIVTSGPGVTNAVTGIATAYMDSIPMVIISGQVPTAAIGEDAFQECDTVGITRPCVKHNFLVRDVKDLAETMRRAFYIARTGRPGPVLVDIPKDVTVAQCKYAPPKGEITMRSYAPVNKGHQGQIKKAVQMLLAAERPMIYTGGGVILSNAAPELNRLVTQLGAPCTSTLMGLGGYPASSGQFVGMPGMHGTYEANMAMQHCDVLLAIGARFDDRVIGNPKHFAQNARKIIHIDIDPSSIQARARGRAHRRQRQGRAGRPERSVRGGRRRAQAGLHHEMVGAGRDLARQGMPEVRGLGRSHQAAVRGGKALGSDRRRRLRHLRRGPAPDVGGAVLQVRQAASLDQLRRPGHHGRGPAVRHGRADGQSGPGDRRHHRRSLDPDEHPGTVDLRAVPPDAQDRLPEQPLPGHGPAVAADRLRLALPESYMDSLPDFVKVAEAYGHVGLRIERPADVEPALREAFKKHKDRLVFLDFITDRTENVWPMVKAGRGLTEMLLGSEDL